MPKPRAKNRSEDKDPELVAFGGRILALRKKAGLTQEGVADASGLHWTYVAQVERGERNLTYRSILRLARGLGVPATRLMPPER